MSSSVQSTVHNPYIPHITVARFQPASEDMDRPSRPSIRKGGKEVRHENDIDRGRGRGEGGASSAAWRFEAKSNRPEWGHVQRTGDGGRGTEYDWAIPFIIGMMRKDPDAISSLHHSHPHSCVGPAILNSQFSADVQPMRNRC